MRKDPKKEKRSKKEMYLPGVVIALSFEVKRIYSNREFLWNALEQKWMKKKKKKSINWVDKPGGTSPRMYSAPKIASK